METADVTRLVLIRHGESRATVDRVVGGHRGCTGLSDLGRRQASALAARLARTGELDDTAVLLASILPRAIETADIIAPALGGLDVDCHCDLCELHPGEGDGLSWDEFETRYPRRGSTAPYRPVSPGGESWAEFMARVGTALRRVAEEHAGRTAVVVCHGGVVEGAFVALGNLPLRRPFGLEIANASITEWSLASGPEAGWTLVRFNDTAHLRDLE